MPASHPSRDPHKKRQLEAKIERYEARTKMEMEERHSDLRLTAAERRIFLAITVLSALLAMALAVLGALHHNPLWYPGGAVGLTIVSGGAAVKLHFLRGEESSR